MLSSRAPRGPGWSAGAPRPRAGGAGPPAPAEGPARRGLGGTVGGTLRRFAGRFVREGDVPVPLRVREGRTQTLWIGQQCLASTDGTTVGPLVPRRRTSDRSGRRRVPMVRDRSASPGIRRRSVGRRDIGSDRAASRAYPVDHARRARERTRALAATPAPRSAPTGHGRDGVPGGREVPDVRGPERAPRLRSRPGSSPPGRPQPDAGAAGGPPRGPRGDRPADHLSRAPARRRPARRHRGRDPRPPGRRHRRRDRLGQDDPDPEDLPRARPGPRRRDRPHPAAAHRGARRRRAARPRSWTSSSAPPSATRCASPTRAAATRSSR